MDFKPDKGGRWLNVATVVFACLNTSRKTERESKREFHGSRTGQTRAGSRSRKLASYFTVLLSHKLNKTGRERKKRLKRLAL